MTRADALPGMGVVASLLAVDPHGLGGVVLRGPPGPARDAWLAGFRDIFPRGTGERDHAQHGGGGSRASRPAGSTPSIGKTEAVAGPSIAFGGHPSPLHGGGNPWRRLPPGADEGRLLGGLDLAATLATGRPVAAPGLLAEADGGVLVVPMAERLGRSAAAHICAALDTGVVVTERDGLAGRAPARFAAVLLDEGRDDERAPEALVERLAFTLDLEKASAEPDLLPIEPDEIAWARARVTEVVVPDDILEALCATGLAFGVPSLRAATLAVRAAKAAAALDGRDAVTREDAELAAALVLAPRATRLPAAQDDGTQDEAEPPPPEPEAPEQPADAADTPPPDEATPGEAQPLADSVAEATRAAIPADLLAALAGAAAGAPRAAPAARAARRGRPPRADAPQAPVAARPAAAGASPSSTRCAPPRRGSRCAAAPPAPSPAACWSAARTSASPASSSRWRR